MDAGTIVPGIGRRGRAAELVQSGTTRADASATIITYGKSFLIAGASVAA